MENKNEEVSFGDLLKELEKQIPVWPTGYPKNIPKKVFFEDIALCQDLCKYMPKKHSANDDDDLLSDEAVSEGTHGKKMSMKRLQRKMKIAELKEKLKTVKGKSLNKKNALKRKGLKNRLKKKIKVEKRVKEKLNKKKNKKSQIPTTEEKVDTDSPVKKQKKSVTDEPNGLVFSKFDFPEGDENSKKKGHVDPMRMLQKVEKSHKKLSEMEARGRIDKVKEIKQKLTWESTIKKAAGEKVKDDIDLLKKSVRKIKNAKNRSKKKWEEREKNKTQKMEEAQKKRKTNLLNKKKEKQKKKVKKLIKKGRIVT